MEGGTMSGTVSAKSLIGEPKKMRPRSQESWRRKTIESSSSAMTMQFHCVSPQPFTVGSFSRLPGSIALAQEL